MKNHNKGYTIVELLLVVAIVGLLAAMLLPMLGIADGFGKNYSTGLRIGVVTKLSEKGIFWKSWEGELNAGGIKTVTNSDGNNATVANIFSFNVAPECVEKVKVAMANGTRVSLEYRQWWIKPVSIDHSHVIIGVTELK